MPQIVREFEKALHQNGAVLLAGVAKDFKLPLRLLLDFQKIPGRSGDLQLTGYVVAGLRRLRKESTCRQSMILAKYLERKAISHVNRTTRHIQRSKAKWY